MRGNFFGKMLSVTTFGESHGPAMGAIVDGVPSKISFSLDLLQKELDRRKPGGPGASGRVEKDQVEILSGIWQGQTLGTPIAAIVRNESQNSQSYEPFKDVFRPGHADRTTMMKYGIRDYRGGGRSSGRETIGRVIGGYFAGLILPDLKITAGPLQVGPWKKGEAKEEDLIQLLQQNQKMGESLPAKILVEINQAPQGLGEPVFDKLKADLAKAMLSIGGCVSFSYGLGEDFMAHKGSEVAQHISSFGGMEGGISNGDSINFQLIFKPPTTIGDQAKTGNHDPCLYPRVIPVVEAMAKLVLADHYLRQRAYVL
ncbi:MAG: chorismate synthase [Pseudomonadota bacterium]